MSLINWLKRNKTGAIVGGLVGLISNYMVGFPRFFLEKTFGVGGCGSIERMDLNCFVIQPFTNYVLPVIIAILLGAFIQSKLRGRK